MSCFVYESRLIFHNVCLVSRWTAGARDNSNARLCCPSADESTVPSLAFILQHMVNGRVKKALSAAVTAEKYFRSPGTISLESLVVFAANPISLEAIRKRMRHHMLGATVSAANKWALSRCRKMQLPPPPPPQEHLSMSSTDNEQDDVICTLPACSSHAN